MHTLARPAAAAICCLAASIVALADPGDLVVEPAIVTAASGTEVRAEFGRLEVPENRSDPASRQIEIQFFRLRSDVEDPAPPLIYLAGGPGGTSVWQGRNERALESWLPYLEIGDVILLDQRGTGAGSADLTYRSQALPPTDVLVSRENADAWMRDLHTRAARAVRERGVDLDGYTTVENADDVNDLRIALGLEKIRLFGFSYGTHLGLSIIRRHGEHVDRAVLVGVEGPDQTYKLPSTADTHLRRLSHIIAADPVVGPEMPDFYAELRDTIAALNADPIPVVLVTPAGEPVTFEVGGWAFGLMMRFDLGDASDLPAFPRLLRTVANGDPTMLEWFVRKRAPGLISVNAMSVVMDTASGGSPERLALIEAQEPQSLLGDVVNPFDERLRAIWGGPDLGDDYRAPVSSDVRTLFLSGALDFNTPPFQAEQARWGFPNSAHIIVTNAGHEQVLPNREVQAAILAFLRGEDVSDRTASNPPLRFVPLEGHDPTITHPSVPAPE